MEGSQLAYSVRSVHLSFTNEARFALRTRLSALGVLLCGAVLAACSGGGGGGGGSPIPRTTPTNSSYRPAAASDSFSYAGTLVQSFGRPPLPSSDVTPSPNPASTETLTSAVTQTVTVSTVASFQSIENPYDFHVAETDVLNGGLKTSTVTSDEYYLYASSGKSKTITYEGSNSTTSDGVTDLDVTGSGDGLVDILPEATGTLSPANNAARTTTETEPDTETDTRAIAANGAYTDNGTYPDGTTSQAILNADGSGSNSFPIAATIVGGTSVGNVSYAVTAPASNQYTLTLTIPPILENNPDPSATPTVESGAFPVWYPLPFVPSNETLTDNGTVALPAACDVPAALTKSTSHQLVDVKTTADPVYGETETETTTTYTEPGIGVACLQLVDTVVSFYDLSGQSQAIINFSPTPLQTTTTAETLGITAATVLGLSSVERASDVAMRAGIAHFHTVLAQRRAQRHAAFRRALVARFVGGHR